MGQVVKVALALPWYNGADRDCVAHFLQFQHYLGRLQERLYWMRTLIERGEWNGWNGVEPLDPYNTTGHSEIPSFDGPLPLPEFQFGLVDETGCSLPGLARERCIDNALQWGADYILMYDDDMQFGTDIFLRLYLAKKLIVGALAFTSRLPITPVIYSFENKYEEENQRLKVDIKPVFDYKPNCLQKVDAVGFGVVMIKADVFRTIQKPWFNSVGMGEDIFFCLRAQQAGIDVWVDTAAKTIHKPTFPTEWHSEEMYKRVRVVHEQLEMVK